MELAARHTSCLHQPASCMDGSVLCGQQQRRQAGAGGSQRAARVAAPAAAAAVCQRQGLSAHLVHDAGAAPQLQQRRLVLPHDRLYDWAERAGGV